MTDNAVVNCNGISASSLVAEARLQTGLSDFGDIALEGRLENLVASSMWI